MSKQSAWIRFGLTTLTLAVIPAAFAQKWEVGGGAGGSFYSSKSITGSAGTADASFKPGFAGTGYLGQNGDRIGGEIRYSYQQNKMELKSGGRSFSMSGRTQAIHYDVLIYGNRKGSKVRPYFLGGGGLKQYAGTGPDVAIQSVGDIAVLTRTSEWKPLITFGGGVKVAASEHVVFRAEFLAQMSQAPKEVIAPISGDFKGWYLNYLPVFTVAYSW